MNTIKIGSQTFTVDNCSSIRVNDGEITINGTSYNRQNQKVEIIGDINCDTIEIDGSLSVKGLITGQVKVGGSLNCDDIKGSVQAGGSVNCNDVEGNVQAGGSVSCGRWKSK